MESAIIKDFDLKIPSQLKDEYSVNKYAKALQELENQYDLQKMLLTSLQLEFSSIKKSLTEEMANGKLTKIEVEKLQASMDYANRIILKSRTEEISGIYSEALDSLTHKPSLKELKTKLVASDYGNCSINNIKLNNQAQILSFNIYQRMKSGEVISSKFDITQDDITAGNFKTRVRPLNTIQGLPEIITQLSMDNGVVRNFTLKENALGEVTNAFFYQEEYQKPWFNVLGFKVGEATIQKEINCESRLPAAIVD